MLLSLYYRNRCDYYFFGCLFFYFFWWISWWHCFAKIFSLVLILGFSLRLLNWYLLAWFFIWFCFQRVKPLHFLKLWRFDAHHFLTFITKIATARRGRRLFRNCTNGDSHRRFFYVMGSSFCFPMDYGGLVDHFQSVTPNICYLWFGVSRCYFTLDLLLFKLLFFMSSFCVLFLLLNLLL